MLKALFGRDKPSVEAKQLEQGETLVINDVILTNASNNAVNLKVHWKRKVVVITK